MSILKDFPFSERVRLQFRAEFFNFFNHTVFRRPNTSFGNNNFGNITAAESARIGQLGLKLYFWSAETASPAAVAAGLATACRHILLLLGPVLRS